MRELLHQRAFTISISRRIKGIIIVFSILCILFEMKVFRGN